MHDNSQKAITAIPADLRDIQGSSVSRMGSGTTQITISWSQCRAFLGHRIISAGVTTAQPGFAHARQPGAMGVIMATVSGSGWAYCTGRWRRIGPGVAVVMPAASFQGHCHAGPGPWRLVWVCYRDEKDAAPVVPGSECTRARIDAESLANAIIGCQREQIGPAEAGIFHHYAALIDHLARRTIRDGHDVRLDAVWRDVNEDLTRHWTLGDLARLAGVSPESLRVACKRVTGHSPVEHVARLRMERAAAILTLSQGTVASVAADVGYDNAFAFSTAFKRVWGVSPATYRGNRRGTVIMPEP